MISVQVRYTKKAQGDASLMDRLRQPMLLGEELAKRIRQRVSQGNLATPAKPYASGTMTGKNGRQRSYRVSQDYATALGLQRNRFASSADFHSAAGTKPNTFSVSGGMWKGIQVRNFGTSACVIDFAGSSLGAAVQSTKTRTGRQRSKPVLVRNADKAARVFRSSQVNVVQPKDTEQEALGAAVCRWTQNLAARALGGVIGPFTSTADPALLQAILQRFDGSK